ncbi:Small ribosomal subunit biogenesis, partial [Spiromyces aspiralis]
MVLQVSSANNVRVYTVSGSNLSRKIPDWLVRRKKRELKKDLEWQTRIELIQDFEFPEASNRVKVTPDGESIMATGVYKPQIRVFECSQLAMKFDRHTDTENINFLILSDDWTKSVHLQADRSIEFHNQGQMHYRARIPKFGRDLCYHYPSCDLLIVGASAEVYRLNLDQGRFLKPLETSSSSGINVCSVNPAHQLWGFGLQDGGVEFWDPRTRSRVGLIEPTVAGLLDMVPGTRAGMEVTALEYRRDGLGLAVGTSSGHTLLYDLRQARPRVVKDQQYGLPIKRIRWIEPHSSSADVGTDTATVLSADAKIIKLWDADNGRALTSIEPPNDINDVTVYPDSGLLMVANEGIEIHSFYIPKLGPAPRWASFLENISEEMEENPQQNIYDDYRFVTRRELEALSLDHLVGTNLLKPYMHGFFVDYRLYERAKAIANPFAYEEYRMQAVKAKIEKDRASRIRATTKLPKVNRALAQ